MICSSCMDLNTINNLIALKVLNSLRNSPLNLSVKYPTAYLTSPTEYLKDISNSKCSKLNSSFYSSLVLPLGGKKKICLSSLLPLCKSHLLSYTYSSQKSLDYPWILFFLIFCIQSSRNFFESYCFESYLIYEYLPPHLLQTSWPSHHHLFLDF